VRLSDRRLLAVLLEEIGIGAARQTLAFHALDKLGRSEYPTRKRALLEDGASDKAIGRLEKLLEIRTWADLEESYPAAASAGEPLHRTMLALDAMGLGEFVDLDLTIVRGLAYYTGTVFELFDAQKALRAICGGGRYDDLLERVGGVDLPALGFGMGDVVLGELLKERGLVPPPGSVAQVFVVAATSDDRPTVLRLVHTLRAREIRVEYALTDLKIGKQLELASARRARFAVVLGPEERSREVAVLKDLDTRGQREVPLSELPDVLVAELSR
jgi:histidyl-tRNA synthetase